jgi:hypothetical protein
MKMLSSVQPKKANTHSVDDSLGRMLSNKWTVWRDARRWQEIEWEKNLRAFNKINESYVAERGGFHDHIYIGSTLEKCLAAVSRISDPLFKTENHWDIEHTPVPEFGFDAETHTAYTDELIRRTDWMRKELEDKLGDIGYEDHLKEAIQECVVLGTGCIKGVLPSVKTVEQWQEVDEQDEYGNITRQWRIVSNDVPMPLMESPSIFNLYVDPLAVHKRDLSGVFERHVVNRSQLEALKDDARFDSEKINDILRSNTGRHTELQTEVERRRIANINTSAYITNNETYDLLEYWGQVSGRELQTAGFVNVDEIDSYWVNIWVCQDKAIFSRLMPMARKVLPYHFFKYVNVPHKFWGIGVAGLNEEYQHAINDTVRDMMDSLAFASKPMSEVNVAMLKEGQDPNVMHPGMNYLRDNGDPSFPAVRFLPYNSPSAALSQVVEMFKQMSDEGTMLPRLSYGYMSGEMNQTMGGLSMQLGVAALPTKVIIKNIEDGAIKPFIKSLFDWVMEWSDREDIKGDMLVNVRCSSVLLAKEQRIQQLMQFSNLAGGNPIMVERTDFEYLLKEVAKALDIDPEKAVPDKPEEQPQEPQVSPKEQAEVELIQAQIATEQASRDKVIAESANKNINTVFSAVQAAAQLEAQQGIIKTADSLLKSAGFEDKDGTPIAQPSGVEQINAAELPSQNTSPQFPPVPQQPMTVAPDTAKMAGMLKMQSPMRGIETMRNE